MPVANHSACVGAAELTCLATLWVEHFGTSRPLAGLALPLGFIVWPLSVVHRALGTIPSTYTAAHDALSKGLPILVFPGGDHESLKPIWQVHDVDFGGRVGFLRIARGARVPIVPLGIRNGGWTAPIVWRSKLLSTLLVIPRLLGVKRWGLSLFGLAIAMALAVWLPVGPLGTTVAIWLWLGSPLVFLPIISATLRFRLGSPLPCAELLGDDTSDDGLRAALTRVERAVEALVRG